MRYTNQKLAAYAIMKIRSIRFPESKVEIKYTFESDIQSDLTSESNIKMTDSIQSSHNTNGRSFIVNHVLILS